MEGVTLHHCFFNMISFVNMFLCVLGMQIDVDCGPFGCWWSKTGQLVLGETMMRLIVEGVTLQHCAFNMTCISFVNMFLCVLGMQIDIDCGPFGCWWSKTGQRPRSNG